MHQLWQGRDLVREKMTVYIVARGEYSDWDIAGVFSTKEKAQEYVENCRYDENAPYILDGYCVGEDGKGAFVPRTFEVDGETSEPPNKLRVTLTRNARGEEVVKVRTPFDGETDEDVYLNPQYGFGGEFSTTVKSHDCDYDKAVKIAMDRRAKTLYDFLIGGDGK